MMTLPTPKEQKKSNAIGIWRETIFNNVARVIGISGSVIFVVYMWLNFKTAEPQLLWSYTIAYALIMLASFRSRIPTVYRISLFATIIFAVGLFSSFENAAVGDGRLWFLLSAFFAVAFLGRRAGLFFVFLVGVTWGIIGYLFTTSVMPPPDVNQFSFPIWAGTTITLLVVGVIMVLTISALLTNLSQNIEKSNTLARRSEEQAKQVEIQKKALERRSNALETSAQISRQIATLTLYQDILDEVPKLLRKEFNLNSAALFLLETENTLRLASCTGWNEQARPKHDYTISVNEDIIGLAVISNTTYSSHTETKVRLKSILPGTQAYAAFPLRGQNTVFGVLLLQSEDPLAFSTDGIHILQMLADHIAILLENAELLNQKERALEAERLAYGEITKSSWMNLINTKKHGGYRRDKTGLSVVPINSYTPKEDEVDVAQIPIKIRGKIIGHIDARKHEKRAWTASEKELLRILASRLETAMDSARLYQDSVQRAERERIISETSARIRETLSIEGVLKTAAKELRSALGVAEAEVWMSAMQSSNKNTAEENQDQSL